jgi:phosphate transport system permease protein
MSALFAIPIGVATAVFLEEFQPRNKWVGKFHAFVQLNITNLAGVPSVVYGILGLTLFVSMGGQFGSSTDPSLTFGVKYFDQFLSAGDRVLLVPIEGAGMPPTIVKPGLRALNDEGEWVDVNVVASRRKIPKDEAGREYALVEGRSSGRIEDPRWYYFRLPFGRSVIAGSLTLMLVVLPIVIISTQEALRGVPASLREAGFGLGATPWQVVRNVTLPSAIPGIMTGAILAMSRATGEAAPILILAGAIFITNSPSSLMDNFTVMPLQIFDWTGRPQAEFRDIAAAGIIVLLLILFVFNSVAVLIRQLAQKPTS